MAKATPNSAPRGAPSDIAAAPAAVSRFRVVGSGRLGVGAGVCRVVRLVCGTVGLVGAIVTSEAGAEPLLTSVGVITRLMATDNLFSTARDPKSDIIGQILPNFTSARTGRRGSWRLYYGPSVMMYAGHSELNRVFQVLQANANFDLIDEYLGLTISANANQNVINPATANTGFNAFQNPDAFAQTAAISIAPVIRLPVLRGDFATLEIEPGLNYVFTARTADTFNNSGYGSPGSQSSFSITSGDYFSRLSWSVKGQSDLIGNDSFNANRGNASSFGNGTGTSTVYGELAYPITEQWSLTAIAGYDWGNYDAVQDPNGPRWRLTPYWQPSRAARIGLGYGQRYDSPDYFVDIGYQLSRTAISLRYDIVVSNARSSILNANVVNFQDAFGQPIAQPLQTQVLSGSVSNPALRGGYFVQDHLNLSATHRFGRTTASLSIDNYRWDYQDTANIVTQNQGTLTVTRALNPRATGSASVQYWIYDQSENGAENFEQLSLTTNFSYTLSRRLTSSLQYTFNQQNSSSPWRGFSANALWATLNWSM